MNTQGLEASPKSSRLHIGLFGRRNAGKSSLLNALAGQPAAIVSPIPGSTTDPVEKTMEMLPLGPVVLIDTAGLDDEGPLGQQRADRSLHALRDVDLALLDVKHMDSVTHEKLVGVPNEYILENIRHIHDDLHVPVILRMPTIPGYNDSIENLHAVGRFAASLGPDVSVNLLPFHKLGESKNESLGHPHSLGIEPPSDQEMEAYRDIVASHGVQVKIGG